MGKGYAKGLFNSEENAASANREHLLCISDYLMGKEETVREPAGSSFWVHQPKADCFVVQWKETIINVSETRSGRKKMQLCWYCSGKRCFKIINIYTWPKIICCRLVK